MTRFVNTLHLHVPSSSSLSSVTSSPPSVYLSGPTTLIRVREWERSAQQTSFRQIVVYKELTDKSRSITPVITRSVCLRNSSSSNVRSPVSNLYICLLIYSIRSMVIREISSITVIFPLSDEIDSTSPFRKDFPPTTSRTRYPPPSVRFLTTPLMWFVFVHVF